MFDRSDPSVQSDLDSARGSGVPEFRKFSAYSRGPRSREVLKFWHPFTAKVTDLKSGRQTAYSGYASSQLCLKIHGWFLDAQADVFNFDVRNFSRHSHSIRKLTVQYILKLQYPGKLKSADWRMRFSHVFITKTYFLNAKRLYPSFHSEASYP